MTRPDRFAELDRFAPLFPAPEVAIESVHRRRAQRRRRRAIAGVAAASLVVGGGMGVLSMARSSDRVLTSSGVEDVDAPVSPATTSLK